MTRRHRDELVEVRADHILTAQYTAQAYADHFEAQMRRGPARNLLLRLGRFRAFGHGGVALLAVVVTLATVVGLVCVAAAYPLHAGG